MPRKNPVESIETSRLGNLRNNNDEMLDRDSFPEIEWTEKPRGFAALRFLEDNSNHYDVSEPGPRKGLRGSESRASAHKPINATSQDTNSERQEPDRDLST